MVSQMEDAGPSLREQSNIDALMQAITTCQTTLMGKINTMQLDISLIRRDMDGFHAQLSEEEQCVGDSEDTLQEHIASLRTMHTKMRALENCGRKMQRTAIGGTTSP